jgi:hypothetical protein
MARNKPDDQEDRVSFSQRTPRLDLGKVGKRRSKAQLTSALIDIYCRVLNDTTGEVAANAIGFSERTLRDWIAKGQDPECTDELLIELAEKHAYVMSNGHRSTIMEIWREHTLDDPKAAMEYAKATIPSLNVPKVSKVDMSVAATKAPNDAAYAELSNEEVAAMAMLERARLKRLSGG